MNAKRNSGLTLVEVLLVLAAVAALGVGVWWLYSKASLGAHVVDDQNTLRASAVNYQQPFAALGHSFGSQTFSTPEPWSVYQSNQHPPVAALLAPLSCYPSNYPPLLCQSSLTGPGTISVDFYRQAQIDYVSFNVLSASDAALTYSYNDLTPEQCIAFFATGGLKAMGAQGVLLQNYSWGSDGFGGPATSTAAGLSAGASVSEVVDACETLVNPVPYDGGIGANYSFNSIQIIFDSFNTGVWRQFIGCIGQECSQ